MGYSYRVERSSLFTPRGERVLQAIRVKASQLLTKAEAFTVEDAVAGCNGNAWIQYAALDYLVEQGELRRDKRAGLASGHGQLFMKGHR